MAKPKSKLSDELAAVLGKLMKQSKQTDGAAAPVASSDPWKQAGGDIAKGASGNPAGALMDATRQEMSNFKQHVARSMGHLAAGVASRSPFQAGGHLMRSAAEVGDTFDPTGVPGKVLKFGATLTESIDRLKKWGDNLHQQNMEFADASPAMARVAAMAEAREFALSQQRGERRSDTAERPAEANNRFAKATASFEDFWGDFQGNLASTLKDAVAPIIADTARALLPSKYTEDKDVDPGIPDWARQAVEQSWAENYGKPARFLPPKSK